ncbi:replication endonuclease [Mannheimia haemolytica]|uniref:replication endonuclease n=1 Tax=Mannheimia haemolytica TaxID=75985 RepID=UPI00115DAB58|nr:replication endonuclease [Mannheimia haemolytica]TRC64852.1 replication endonuclease [Mannheimia haemolytica]
MNYQNEILSAAEALAMGVSLPPVAGASAGALELHSDRLYQAFKQPYTSMVQQELFSKDPIHEPLRQSYFERLPRALAEHFGRQYKQKLHYQSQYDTADWFKAEMARKMPRIEAVISQYCDVFDFLKQSHQDLDFLAELDSNVYFGAGVDTQQAVQKIKQDAEVKGIQLPMHLCRLENSSRYLKAHGIRPLAYQTEEQIKQLALGIAYRVRQIQQDNIEQNMHKATDGDTAYSVLLECYRAMMGEVNKLKIDSPYQKKARKSRLTQEEITTGFLKMTCEKWWTRKLSKIAEQMKEHLAIACGMVNMLSPYCSNARLKAFEAQRKANIDYLKSMIIANIAEPEEQLSLFETWLKSASNPKIKRLELLTRMNGFERYADKQGHEGWFITLTAPSKYHAMLSRTSSVNPKWNGASPAETQAYLVNTWAKIRAKLNREGVMAYGFRVAEPHADATPHWHLILFTRPEDMEKLRRVFLSYALEVDGTEAGAKKYRCKFKRIEKEKGTATGYLVKYVSKNIDGFGMDGEFSDEANIQAKENAARVGAWSSVWCIRQFQQLGNIPISLWRELRRLGSVEQEDETLEKLRVIADSGEWDVFTEELGGALVKRADLVARITYTERKSETGEALYTMYQEPSLKVSGIINIKNGVQINTRPKEWSIQLKPKNWEEQQLQKKLENATETERAEAKRKYYEKLGFNEEAIALLGELAPPWTWTCVSNCTGSKNNQISEEARNCLRNELITMRGRVTEHQIDDLLNGKRLKIWGNSQKTIYLTYNRGRLIEQIVDNYECFLN